MARRTQPTVRIFHPQGLSSRYRHWSGRISSAARTARMGLRPRAVILLYHRIASPAIDPLLLSVAPGHFADHMAILRRDYHPITLAELAEACAENRISDRSVAITFDDGYADNLRAAAPILEREGQKATVFVTGACLDGTPLFYDELERILLWTPQLPARIRIRVNGHARVWEMGEWARRPKKPDGDFLHWNMEWFSDPTPRHRCYRELFDILRAAPVRVRTQTMASLRKAAGIERRRPPHRLLMTQAELRKAARGNALEIGAHTRNHPALNRLTTKEQRDEIASGKRLLEQAIGREVRAFAYPYGSPWDVAPETVQLAREAGFAVACGDYPGPVDSESDLFWLPRCLVRNWSGEEFERRMREFFRPRAEIPPRG
ncbi:MAG: polysaccharide deacetylase family protein [Anaerolineales bacterium]